MSAEKFAAAVAGVNCGYERLLLEVGVTTPDDVRAADVIRQIHRHVALEAGRQGIELIGAPNWKHWLHASDSLKVLWREPFSRS